MCQRAKSRDRSAKDKVPAPKPADGAPMPKAFVDMAAVALGFFVPGFFQVGPMGRFQAAFGMSSLA